MGNFSYIRCCAAALLTGWVGAVSGVSLAAETDVTVVVAGPAAVTKISPIPFTITFSEPVTGLTAAEMQLTNGTAGALTGSGKDYVLSVTPSAQGAVTCKVPAGAAQSAGSASNLISNIASTIFDTVRPAISASYPSLAFTSNTDVTYTVTCSDANLASFTLTAADITLRKIGTMDAAISVSGTGTTRTVTLSNITGNGVLSIDIAAGVVVDLAGNTSIPIGTNYFTVDNKVPVMTIYGPSASIARIDSNIDYHLTCSEIFGVVDVGTEDVILHRTGTANADITITPISPSEPMGVRRVRLSNITGDGKLGISVAAGVAVDSAGNASAAVGPSPNVTVDNTPPTVTVSAPSRTATKDSNVTYAITYADAAAFTTSLTAADVTLNKTGTASGTVGVTVVGTTPVVVISDITGEGTLGISLAAGTATDTLGNVALAAGPSDTFTVDNAGPSVAISEPSTSMTRNGSVTYTVTYADSNFASSTLTAGKMTLNKTGTANGTMSVSGSGTTRTVTISDITGDGTLGISLAAGTATDTVGNVAAAAGPSATFAVDNTAPSVTLSAPSTTLTGSSDVTYTVTYADDNFAASTLTAGNITLNKTGTANGSLQVTGSGTARTVTISDITGNGTLGISLAAGTATDILGNLSAAAGPSATLVVDNTPPTVAVSAPSLSRTRTSDVSYQVNYADAHFGQSTLAAKDITLIKTGSADAVVEVAGSGTIRLVTLSGITGEGTLAIAVGSGTAVDTVGNLAPAHSASAAVVVDGTAATLSSVHLASDNAFSHLARKGDVLSLTFTASEEIEISSAVIANQSAVVTHIGGNAWKATTTVLANTAEGPVGFSLAFADLAGNTGSAAATTDASAITVDVTAPSLSTVRIGSSNANPLYAKGGDTITVDMTATETLQMPAVSIAGQAAVLADLGNNAWRATRVLPAGAERGPVGFLINFHDRAGNAAASVTTTTDGSSVIIDDIPPKITTQPLARTVNPGTDVEFTVAADSLSPLSYQWYKGEQLLDGAIGGTLALSGVDESDEGVYHAIASNVVGGSTSYEAALEVNDPVEITQQPLTQTVNQNRGITFRVAATGTPPLAFQWRRNGVVIDDAAGDHYTLAGAQADHQGVYDVIVSNIVGGKTSDPAELIVLQGAPKIVSQPGSKTVTPSMSVTFSVTAAGTAPFMYQWKKKGVAIPSATLPTFTIASATSADAADYIVTVSNSFGSVNSDPAKLTVLKAASYVFAHLAGKAGDSGSVNGPAASARFAKPHSVVRDSTGNFFVADRDNHLIRKVTAAGEVTTFAGTAGTAGVEDGAGTLASFSSPVGLAIDNDDNLYVADSGSHLIRKVTPTGEVTTVAGTANVPGADDGVGTAATFQNPAGLALDADGWIYVADYGNHTLRKIAPDGAVSTVAGVVGSFGTEDGAGSVARLNRPAALVVVGTGLYVVEEGNHAIRFLNAAGDLSTVAGKKGTAGVTDGPGAVARFKSPAGIAADSSGNLFVCDTGNHTIRMITSGGMVTTIGGSAGAAGSANGPGGVARFRAARGLTVDPEGRLCVVDTDNHVVRTGTPQELPEIEEQPEPLLVAAGGEATFSVVATGAAPLTYQWYKGAVAIKDATEPTYRIPATNLASSGRYKVVVKNNAGSVTSATARLGVLDVASQIVIANEGTTATLKIKATGEGLIYLWRRTDGEPMDARFTGVEGDTLRIKPVRQTDTAEYTCMLRLGDRWLESGVVNLKAYHLPPEFAVANETVLDPGIVGGGYQYAVPVSMDVKRWVLKFSASGLPAGLKIDPVSGILSGRPTAAASGSGPYRIVVTAANARGRVSVTLLLNITPLPPLALGTFNGLVNADPVLNGGYGGTINVVTTKSGSFSGDLLLAGVSHKFRGALDVPLAGDPSAEVVISRKGMAPVNLDFTLGILNGKLVGSVDEGGSDSAALMGWRSTAPPASLVSMHTAAIVPHAEVPEDPASHPQGEGYAVLKITKSGAANWSGRLADGSTITAGTTVGPNGEVPFHLMLYANTGNVQGWTGVDLTTNDVDGELVWSKAQQLGKATRSYQGGISPHRLVLVGGKFAKQPGDPRVIGLPADLQIEFSSGGLVTTLTQPLTLTAANAVVLKSPNPAKAKFATFSATTGLFSGGFELNEDPPVASLRRPAVFNGAFVRRLGRGVGHFLLPMLPSAPGSTVNNTPVLSGQVSLEPAAP